MVAEGRSGVRYSRVAVGVGNVSTTKSGNAEFTVAKSCT